MADIILTITFIATATLLGFSFSQNLVNRRKTLEGIIEALNKMKTYIGFSAMEIVRISAEVFKPMSGFEAFMSYQDPEISFNNWWESCVLSLDKSTGLDKDDKELLIRFAQGIGVSDVEGQISHLDLYIELFSERLKLAKDSEAKKSRLYKILGFSLGCAVTLIIV